MSNALALRNATTLTGTYEKDLEKGAKIRDAAESLQWMLGDWVNEMQARYEESHLSLAKDLTATTGVAANTLRQYAQVAKAFAPAERSTDLSYTHHLRAASAENPVKVLQAAAADGLSERDTARLAKGLPLGGEDTAQKQSSIAAAGASMEEVVLESIAIAEQHLARALATLSKPGFRLTVDVGQDIIARLQACAKPYVSIEEAVKAEVGAYL